MDKNLHSVQLLKNRRTNHVFNYSENKLIVLLEQFFTSQKKNPVWHIQAKTDEEKPDKKQAPGEITVPPQENNSIPPQNTSAVPPAPSPTDNGNDNSDDPDNVETLDFSNMGDLRFTEPVTLIYYWTKHKVTSWRSLYVTVCKLLLLRHPATFERMKEESLHGEGGLNIVDYANKDKLLKAGQFGNDFYIEVNRNSSDLMRNLKKIIDRCGEDYGNIVVKFTRSKADEADPNEDIRAALEKLSRENIGCISAGMVSKEINSRLYPYQVLQILDQVDWAEKIRPNAYRYIGKKTYAAPIQKDPVQTDPIDLAEDPSQEIPDTTEETQPRNNLVFQSREEELIAQALERLCQKLPEGVYAATVSKQLSSVILPYNTYKILHNASWAKEGSDGTFIFYIPSDKEERESIEPGKNLSGVENEPAQSSPIEISESPVSEEPSPSSDNPDTDDLPSEPAPNLPDAALHSMEPTLIIDVNDDSDKSADAVSNPNTMIPLSKDEIITDGNENSGVPDHEKNESLDQSTVPTVAADDPNPWADESIRVLDIADPEDLSDTPPVSIHLFKDTISSVNTWEDVYVQFLSLINSIKRNALYSGMCLSPKSKMIDIRSKNSLNSLGTYRKIPFTNLYARMDGSVVDYFERIRFLLDKYKISYDKLKITYRRANSASSNNAVITPDENTSLKEIDKIETEDHHDLDSPAAQPRWTLMEAAVLLDAYLQVLKEPEKRKDYIQLVSNQLRQIAINQGMQISDIYRNITGIKLQMNALETAWTEKDVNHFLTTKIFSEIVRLYREERDTFDKLLLVAQRLSGNVPEKPDNILITKQGYRDFLEKQGVSVPNRAYYCACLESMAWEFHEKIFEMEASHCAEVIKKIYGKIDVYGTTSNKQEALRQFETYLREKELDSEKKLRESRYRKIMSERFFGGFKLNSFIFTNKFKNAWKDTYPDVPVEEDSEIPLMIRSLGIEDDNMVYLLESVMDEEQKGDLLAYLRNREQNGDKGVFYQVIYDDLLSLLVNTKISTPDFLKKYMVRISPKTWKFHGNFVEFDPKQRFIPSDVIRDYLRELGMPDSYSHICKEITSIPAGDIKWMLNHEQDILYNSGDSWYQRDIIELSPKEWDQIRDLIYKHLKADEYVLVKDIYHELRNVYPLIGDQIQIISPYGFQNLLKWKFSALFSFSGSVISYYSHSIDTSGIFKNFAKRNVPFQFTDLKTLASELGTGIYFESVFTECIRISENDYVHKDCVHFDVGEIDDVLDELCPDKYIALREITTFHLFPSIGVPWNSFVLEQYVYQYSLRFKLCHSVFSFDSCPGGIVRQGVGINDFKGDLIPSVLAESEISLTKKDALNYLLEKGYILSKGMDINDEMLQKAKKIRQNLPVKKGTTK